MLSAIPGIITPGLKTTRLHCKHCWRDEIADSLLQAVPTMQLRDLLPALWLFLRTLVRLRCFALFDYLLRWVLWRVFFNVPVFIAYRTVPSVTFSIRAISQLLLPSSRYCCIRATTAGKSLWRLPPWRGSSVKNPLSPRSFNRLTYRFTLS